MSLKALLAVPQAFKAVVNAARLPRGAFGYFRADPVTN
jgi:hypothetical protein